MIRKVLAAVTVILHIITACICLANVSGLEGLGWFITALKFGGVCLLTDVIWLVYGCAKFGGRTEERYVDDSSAE